jgi:ribose-phosphate pyrophosphokinase
VDGLSPLALFAEAFRRFADRDDVVAVAPDAGASKFVTYFGRALALNCAIASKYRPEPEQAIVSEIIGDFRAKRVAIVLDDMISTGGTIEAVVVKLVEEKGIEEIRLGVSHNLCTDAARQRLSDLHARYHLREVVVTDSVPQTEAFQALPFSSIRSLSGPLYRVISRIHTSRSVNGLLARPKSLGKE